MRKIALLTGVAGALLLAGPTLAQEATPPAQEQQTPPAAEAAASGNVTLSPGATVRGEGGAELGKLEGVQANADGSQSLTVRGSDGSLRAVPLDGFRMEGADVAVGFSLEQYNGAEVIPGEPPVPAEGAVPPTPPTLPEAVDPTDPSAGSNPMTPTEAPEPDQPTG